ncbi:MAG: D-alanyl-D-alanine carboxypeptidase [Clostridia bacterium]|nr:D-alanyl-D-alanine carboxypeptidase [Clostridia bacterium]
MVFLLKKVLSIIVTAAIVAALSVPVLAAPSVSAESAILVHADTGTVLFSLNADEKMLVASTTKILTAIVVIENCDMDDKVEIGAESVGVEGSSMYLRAGETYTVEQLLYGLMLVSGNDAATALAIHVAGSIEDFARLMNLKAAEVGMDNSHFENPHGLDEDGHYSTARDLAMLACCCMENETFRSIVSTRSYKVGDQTLVNHNRLLWTCKGAIGLKTGYTCASGRSLVSCAERDGARFVCVTLSDPEDWDDHTALYDWAFSQCEYKTVASEGDCFTLPVVSGAEDVVAVSPESELRVMTLCGEEPELSVELPRFVFAPVTEGETAGEIIVSQNGKVIGSCKLVFSDSVVLQEGIELTPWERFGRVWKMAGRCCGYSYYLASDRGTTDE